MKTKQEQLLETVCKRLDEAEVNYWLAAGTLLSLFRERRLFPGDDIDIWYFPEDENIQEILADYELYVVQKHDGLLQQVAYKHDDIVIDLHPYYQDGDNVINWAYPQFGTMVFDADLFTDVIPFRYKGYTYPIPRKTREYLTAMYGDWETPHEYDNWWEHTLSLDADYHRGVQI